MRRYLRATFDSLHNRNYRRYFVGQGISVTGTWMQKVAQAWLVLELTDSGTLLGVTAAMQQLPTLLLTAWGGVLADRVDKRKILLLTQSAAAVPAMILGVLTLTGHVTIWVVLVLALALGTIESLDKPARMTFVTEIVDSRHLTNAVTLNNIVQNVGKVVGPAIAGILIGTVGLGYSFLVNAASFLAVLAGLWMIKPDQPRKPAADRSRGQVRQGLGYVRRRRELLGPLVLMTVAGTLAYNWQVLLLLLARDTFHEDARAAGLMFTAMGLGAIVGGLSVAGALRATTRGLLVSSMFFATIMLATAVSPTLTVAFIALFVLGAASVSFRAIAISMVQLRAEPEMRGRVVALLIIATGGTTPVGGPIIGWVSEMFGARTAFAVGGVSTAVAAIATFAYVRRARSRPLAKERPVPAASAGELDD